MSDAANPLAPIDTFKVDNWTCTIKQLVTGTLIWEATHVRLSPRAGRFPVGFSAEMVRDEVRKILTQDSNPTPSA